MTAPNTLAYQDPGKVGNTVGRADNDPVPPLACNPTMTNEQDAGDSLCPYLTLGQYADQQYLYPYSVLALGGTAPSFLTNTTYNGGHTALHADMDNLATWTYGPLFGWANPGGTDVTQVNQFLYTNNGYSLAQFIKEWPTTQTQPASVTRNISATGEGPVVQFASNGSTGESCYIERTIKGLKPGTYKVVFNFVPASVSTGNRVTSDFGAFIDNPPMSVNGVQGFVKQVGSGNGSDLRQFYQAICVADTDVDGLLKVRFGYDPMPNITVCGMITGMWISQVGPTAPVKDLMTSRLRVQLSPDWANTTTDTSVSYGFMALMSHNADQGASAYLGISYANGDNYVQADCPPGHLFFRFGKANFDTGGRYNWTDLGSVAAYADENVSEFAMRTAAITVGGQTGWVRCTVWAKTSASGFTMLHDEVYDMMGGQNIAVTDCNCYYYAGRLNWHIASVDYLDTYGLAWPSGRYYRWYEWEQKWSGDYSDLTLGSVPTTTPKSSRYAYGYTQGESIGGQFSTIWARTTTGTGSASANFNDTDTVGCIISEGAVKVLATASSGTDTAFYTITVPDGYFSAGQTVNYALWGRKRTTSDASYGSVNFVRLNGGTTVLKGATTALAAQVNGTMTKYSGTITATSAGGLTMDIGTFGEGATGTLIADISAIYFW